jgi:hypothetical protein
VVPSSFVLRALKLMGLGSLPIYLTLNGALAHADHDRG